MYEEKPRRKFNIDWKSLLIKLAILFVVVFIIMWLISLVTKDKKEVKESNISTNLQIMKEAAFSYFTDSTLPENINGKKKITLDEMIDSKLLVEFKDQYNNACDKTNSYAEATKINSTDYTIKVKLICGSESDYIINTIKTEANINDNNNIDENVSLDDKEDSNTNNNNSSSTNNSTNSSNNSNNTSNTNSSTKPNTNSNIKPNTNSSTSTTTKPNNTTNNTVATTTCKYGSKDYSTTYPVAYVITGNCAVSKAELYQAKYANAASNKGTVEYKKLYKEIAELKAKTGANIYVETPVYSEVLNKNNTGYIGYQIMYVVKQKLAYTTKVIYQYYLATDGTRKVVVDNRASLNATNNSTTTVKVESVTLNKTSINLYEGETYTLKATINPNNATNKAISWTSDKPKIATVDANGKVTALKEGTAIITATIDGVSDKVRIRVLEESTCTYCEKNTERVYSVGYIDLNTLANKTTYSYNYRVALEVKNIENVYDVETYNVTGSKYKSAYKYLTNKNKDLSLVNSKGNGIDPGNYKTLENSSLKSYNLDPNVKYVGRDNNTLYFDVEIDLINLNRIKNTDAYKVSANYAVYFIPLYFEIVYYNDDDCKEVKESQVADYKSDDYIKID